MISIQRYLDHVITTHQNLPVAGFETNLRVPMPLENVYVTLQARMTEIDHARDGRRALVAEMREFQPDRSVTVQEALQFALGKNYDGVVILGQPGFGKTTLAKYFLLCFATGKAEKNLQLAHKLLPIVLFLREVDPKKSCLENILAALQKHQLGLDEKFFGTLPERRIELYKECTDVLLERWDKAKNLRLSTDFT